jgi:thioredoxin reductase
MEHFDVIVIGGGPAGLSAAVTLGRARRSTLVLDAGRPRNATAPAVHNFLTRDHASPAEIARAGVAEVERYGGRVLAAEATGAHRDGTGIVVETDHGAFHGRRLVVATGLVDDLPDVPGLRERWGRDVFACPYCHALEFADQPLGVLGSGALAVHGALLLRQWTADLTLFTGGGPTPTSDELAQLRARGVAVVDGEVTEVVADEVLRGVRIADRRTVPVRGLGVAAPLRVNSPVLDALGLPRETLELFGAELGDHYPSDPRTGATALPGVFLAGNVTDPSAQVVTAAGAGLLAAVAVNSDLVVEETAAALAG